MRWLKAAIVGLAGSLVMLAVMKPLIAMGVAPFNVPPSAAFLIKLGLPPTPLALLVHLGYGATMSVVLYALARDEVNVGRGLALACILWLIMMMVYSPIIGWGLFGFGAAASALPAANPLHLAPGPKYLVATLVLHALYGVTIGGLGQLWIGRQRKASRPTAEERRAAGQSV